MNIFYYRIFIRTDLVMNRPTVDYLLEHKFSSSMKFECKFRNWNLIFRKISHLGLLTKEKRTTKTKSNLWHSKLSGLKKRQG